MLLSVGGGVPGKAEPWPGIEYWGLNWAKLVPNAAGNWPWWNPLGNCPAGVICDPSAVAPPVALVARRDKIDLSDIWSLCATGGILANEAGRRETSDFMSDSNSSNWFNTLWRTALAGLFPAKLSLDKCWWDSARHSTYKWKNINKYMSNKYIINNLEYVVKGK